LGQRLLLETIALTPPSRHRVPGGVRAVHLADAPV
jgi:hypothetical protein